MISVMQKAEKKGIPPKASSYHLDVDASGRRDRLHSLHVAESGRQSVKHVDDLNGSALIQEGEVKKIYGH
jgi:hypothetical protein